MKKIAVVLAILLGSSGVTLAMPITDTQLLNDWGFVKTGRNGDVFVERNRYFDDVSASSRPQNFDLFDPSLGTLDSVTLFWQVFSALTTEATFRDPATGFPVASHDVQGYQAQVGPISYFVSFPAGPPGMLLTHERFEEAARCSDFSVVLGARCNTVKQDAEQFETGTIFDTAAGDDLSFFVGPGQGSVLFEQQAIFLTEITSDNISRAFVESIKVQLAMFGGLTISYTYTPAVVPIPAAVWLFASALGLLGWLKRRAA